RAASRASPPTLRALPCPPRVRVRASGDPPWLLTSHAQTRLATLQPPASIVNANRSSWTSSRAWLSSRSSRAAPRMSSARTWCAAYRSGSPHEVTRHHRRSDRCRQRRPLGHAQIAHPRTPLHHTVWTRIQEPNMTIEDSHAWRDLAQELIVGQELIDGWKAERERRIKAEHDLIALQAEVNELWPYRKRAEKAEKERDEWEKIALAAERDADEAEENPRPLTPDDITDEMVRRGAQVATPAGVRYLRPHEVREILTAALTEPPTRPEGAEKVEAVLHQYWSGDINGDDLADRIAEEMNR